MRIVTPCDVGRLERGWANAFQLVPNARFGTSELCCRGEGYLGFKFRKVREVECDLQDIGTSTVTTRAVTPNLLRVSFLLYGCDPGMNCH